MIKVGKTLLIKDVKLFYNQFNSYLKNNKILMINLNELISIDTAGLALLIEFKYLAENNNKKIQFIDVPECIYKLGKLYQVDSLFV